MAAFDHLPIYKATYDLLFDFFRISKHFPKEYRYSIAERALNLILEVVLDIYIANSSKQKAPAIGDILKKTVQIGVLVRVSQDLKIISEETYAALVEKTSTVMKQATGWLNFDLSSNKTAATALDLDLDTVLGR